jgi:elongation factor G
MSAAIHRLADEDPSLTLQHNQDTGETILSGHGEMHLRVVREKLEGRNQIPIDSYVPAIPYRETIKKSVTQRGRHKKQSGGHGQFGDVVLEIKPLPRGTGFQFSRPSLAASCRAIIFRRSKPGSAIFLRTARSVFRWSMSR